MQASVGTEQPMLSILKHPQQSADLSRPSRPSSWAPMLAQIPLHDPLSCS